MEILLRVAIPTAWPMIFTGLKTSLGSAWMALVAAELLASTDRKIADIGALCGFQEMSYFAKTFRTLKGRTPSAYRAEKRAAGLRKL